MLAVTITAATLLDLMVLAGTFHSEALESVGDALIGIGELTVALSGEADHEAVTNELGFSATAFTRVRSLSRAALLPAEKSSIETRNGKRRFICIVRMG